MCKIYKRFDNVKTFAEYIDNGKTQKNFEHYTASISGSKYFTGSEDFPSAHKLLLYGDKNLQKKIEAAGVSDVRTNIRKYVVRRELYSSVVGAVPNVPAYLAGAPNSMVNIRMKKQRHTVVNVGYNSAVLAGVNADNIVKCGARLVSALMILEARGIKSNVYCLDLDVLERQYVSYSIKIKSSGQKFDTLRMAYFLAHPSMNRRHKFRFQEITDGVTKDFVSCGYGQPETRAQKMIEHFKEQNLNLDAAFCYESLKNMSVEDIINTITGDGK